MVSESEFERKLEELSRVDPLTYKKVIEDQNLINMIKTMYDLYSQYNKTKDTKLRNQLAVELGRLLATLHDKYGITYTVLEIFGIPKATAHRFMRKAYEAKIGVDREDNTGGAAQKSLRAESAAKGRGSLEHTIGKLIGLHTIDEVYWWALLGREIVRNLRDAGIDIPHEVPIAQAESMASKWAVDIVNMIVEARRDQVLAKAKAEVYRKMLEEVTEICNMLNNILRTVLNRLGEIYNNIVMAESTYDGYIPRELLENIKDDLKKVITNAVGSTV